MQLWSPGYQGRERDKRTQESEQSADFFFEAIKVVIDL